jgi:hypothetical protein
VRSAGVQYAEVCLESGRPAPAIGRLADAVRADLIVVGRSPVAAPLRALRMKCLDIASEALCPVAIVQDTLRVRNPEGSRLSWEDESCATGGNELPCFS